MAKITTGSIDLLRVLFDQVNETFSPVGSFRELLAKALGSETVSADSFSSEAVLHQHDGGKVTLVGDLSANARSNWKITELTYESPEGPTLRARGSVKLTDAGSFGNAAFTEISVTDVNRILDASGRQLVGGFTGMTTVSVTAGGINSHVLIKNMTKEFSNGYTLFQEATKGLKDYDSQAPMESYAEVIDQSTGRVLLKLEPMRDPQIPLDTADDFIAFHLNGNDSIIGTADADFLYAGSGSDTVNAGAGADLIVGGDGAGNDSYDGGAGTDTVKYTSAKDGITVDLAKGAAFSTTGADAAGIGIDKLKNIENLIAGDFADTLTGSKDANSMVGGQGDDTIDGGLGKDTLVGGDGADVFVFSTKPAANNMDTIADFETGKDTLRLSSKVFAKLKGVTDFLALGSVSDSPTHYLIYDSATGKLSYDADGSGTKFKSVDIAIIGNKAALTATDIVIV